MKVLLQLLSAWFRAIRIPALVLGFVAFPSQADGLIVIHNPPRGPVGHHAFAPLAVKYHHVTVRIQDQMATTEVDQIFYNPNDRQLEGTYLFPIPKNAQIDKLSMNVNGRMQEAELLDATKARGIYEEIVRRALDPALLEYIGQGLFKLRVFPIEPRSEKRIRLSYSQLLKQENDLVEYVYPLNTEKFSSAPIERVSIQVVLETGQSLKSVYSPSHDVEIRRRDAQHATVGFETKASKPDTDFQLFFSTQKRSDLGMTLLTYKDDADPEGYFLLLASPPVQTDRVMPKDVVFVLDTSGSMAESGKLEQAKRALNFCLANLNRGDRFDLVRFSTETESLFEQLVDANHAHLDKARRFVQELRPVGGTAIDEALSEALKVVRNGDPTRPCVLVFLTDGQPTIGTRDEGAILAGVARNRGGRNIRIFSFGIGTDVNTHLLDELASQTRAASQYVLPKEDIEVKVSAFYAKITHPVLANPKLSVSGDIRFSRTYPSALPDLFKGEQLVVAGRYRGDREATLTLTGMVNGETARYQETFRLPTRSTDHVFIPKLWATRRIGFLLDEIRLHGEQAEVRNEVTDLARRFGIVTPYTAYLIVEDEARRAVPMANRTMQTSELVTSAREVGGSHFADMRKTKSGSMAVGRAQAFDALKRAENMAAPAMANIASQKVLSGRDAKDGERLQNAMNTQSNRFVAGRTFYQNGSQWTDANVATANGANATKARTVQVRFNTAEYYALMKKHPDAPKWLSVGRNVQVLIGGTIYDVID